MVKAYLRYEQTASWGVLTSGASIVAAPGGKLATAALENVALWNLKQGTVVGVTATDHQCDS